MSTAIRRALNGAEAFRGDALTDRIYLRLFTARYTVLNPSHWNSSNVCNSYWRFYVNDDPGAALFVRQGDTIQRCPLEAGRIYFVPAGVRFDCRCEVPSVRHLYAHFDITGLPGLLLRELFDRPVCLPVSPGLQARAEELRDSLIPREGRATGDDLVLHCRWKAALYDAIALALEALPNTERERQFNRAIALEPILPALEKIERDLADHLSNADLAATCFWSEDYFIRRFKECVGEPPAAYVQSRRVEAAAQRLLFSADSIEQIAVECGFGNRFYFSRVFARHTGLAPAAYRKTARI